MRERMGELEQSRETTEILPANLGDLSVQEATPILERASRKIDILHVKKNELWQGIQANIDGARGWIEANGRKLASKTVRAIAGGAFVLSTLAACGQVGAVPVAGPAETAGPVVTEVMPAPTAEPTKTPEPTENPNSISSQEILNDTVSKIDINQTIKGRVYIQEERSDLDFPNLPISVTLAVGNDVGSRADLPFTEISLNPYFNKEYGSGSRQIAADMAWAHYNAWQHDEDDKYYSERKRVYFEDYLKKASEGKDGSHLVWAITEKGKIFPNEQVRVDVHTPTVVVFVNEAPHGQITEILYDKNQKTLIFKVFLPGTNSNLGGLQPEDQGFVNFTTAIAWMSLGSDIQKLGTSRAGIPDEKFGKILREISQSMWPGVSNPKGFSAFITTSPTRPQW